MDLEDCVALIGNGPCIKDLHSRPERRIVVAVQGGILHVKEPHFVVVYDVFALDIYKEAFSFYNGPIVSPNVFPRKHMLGGSFGYAMQFCFSIATTVEIYGVDLEDNDHSQGRTKAAELLKLHPGKKIINCCPSSKMDLFPFEERPWTSAKAAQGAL